MSKSGNGAGAEGEEDEEEGDGGDAAVDEEEEEEARKQFWQRLLVAGLPGKPQLLAQSVISAGACSCTSVGSSTFLSLCAMESNRDALSTDHPGRATTTKSLGSLWKPAGRDGIEAGNMISGREGVEGGERFGDWGLGNGLCGMEGGGRRGIGRAHV